MKLEVHISGALAEFVARHVEAEGQYEDASEYVHDLIRRDRERIEGEMFAALKAELQRAFATPDEEYIEVDADSYLEELRQRHRSRRANLAGPE